MAKDETRPRRTNATDRPRSGEELRQAALSFAVDAKAAAIISSRRKLSALEQQVISRIRVRAEDFLSDLSAAPAGDDE